MSLFRKRRAAASFLPSLLCIAFLKRPLETCFRVQNVACARGDRSFSPQGFLQLEQAFSKKRASKLPLGNGLCPQKSGSLPKRKAPRLPMRSSLFYRLCEELQTSLTHFCIQDLFPVGSCMTLSGQQMECGGCLLFFLSKRHMNV